MYNYIYNEETFEFDINYFLMDIWPKTHPPNHTELEPHQNVPIMAIPKIIISGDVLSFCDRFCGGWWWDA
jgi:hypothetical protein